MKRKVFILLFCCFTVLLGIYTGRNFNMLITAFTDRSISDNIFYSAFDGEHYYSIVNSRSEVVLLNQDGICIKTIVPEMSTGARINGVIPDRSKEQLYVWCTYFDESGSYIALEEILRYSSKGEFINVLYSKEYVSNDTVPISGRIRSLSVLDSENLGVAITEDEYITVLEIDCKTGNVLAEESFVWQNAPHIVFDVYLDSDISKIYFSTKQGKIYESHDGTVTSIFDIGDIGQFVPSKIHVLPDKSVLVKENFNSQIVKILPDGQLVELLSASDVGLDEITSFYVTGNTLLISNNYKILLYLIDGDSLININTCDKLRYSLLDYVKSYILFALILLTIVAIFILAGKIIHNLTSDNKQIFRQIVIISLSLSLTVGIISYYVFKTLDERTAEANYNLLMIHFEYLSKIIDAEKVENINNVSQFNSEDFNVLVDQLNQSLTIEGEQDHSKYVGIFKRFDDKIVIITYQDMDESYFTPLFSDYQTNGMYLPVFVEGKIVKNISDDAEGRWQYVFGPIYNDAGEIVAIAEIGLDLAPYTEANNTLFMNLLLKLVSIMVVLMLLFVEYTIYENKVINKISAIIKTDDDLQSITSGSVRAVSVMLFIGVFLNSTFMPVYSSNLYSDFFSLPHDIVIAVPIVTESLFLIISILGFSRFRKKVNFKLALLIGGIIYSFGSILTAISANTSHLTISRAVVGIGYGIIYIALKAYIAGRDKKFSNEELIAYSAGMTCGVSVGGVLGSIIADFVGYRYTFAVVAAIMLIASLMAWQILDVRCSTIEHQESKPLSGIRLLLNKDVIIYYIFEFLPAAVCGSFLLYFLPLIADRLGYSTTLVGQIFLLNALFSIYSGPALTRITSKIFGVDRSLVLAGFIYSAVIFYVAFNTTSIAIIALAAIIIGIVDSFKENQEADYFLDLDACKNVGETKAVSYFSMFECSGEAFGPIIYAFILSMGTSQGLMALGVILPISVTLFGLNARKSAKRLKNSSNLSA